MVQVRKVGKHVDILELVQSYLHEIRKAHPNEDVVLRAGGLRTLLLEVEAELRQLYVGVAMAEADAYIAEQELRTIRSQVGNR